MTARFVSLVVLALGAAAAFGFESWLWLAGALAVVAAYLTYGVVQPRSQMFGPVLWRGPPSNRPEVAISFDDGPDPQTTPALLDVLLRHQAKATFFVIGKKALAQPELTRRIIDDGHELANHSYSHDRLLNLRPRAAHMREMTQCRQVLADLNADSPWYRPPMGLTSPPAMAAAKSAGLQVVCWSVSARDGGSSGLEAAKKRLSRVRAGDIVLLHDGHDLDGRTRTAALELVPWLLEHLSQQGLQTVTLGALFKPTVV